MRVKVYVSHEATALTWSNRHISSSSYELSSLDPFSYRYKTPKTWFIMETLFIKEKTFC